jgi:hypothetical protein
VQPASVRAVCYRLFAAGVIDSMSKANVAAVGRQLTDARERDWLPWAWIVDETRAVEAVPTWADPARFAEAVTRSYRRAKWDAQPVRVEVWSEKGTVRGTLAPVLDRYEVPFRVMHGFASATTVHDIADATRATRQPLVALYVGDFDPSGLCMSETDLPGRLADYGADDSLTITRLALLAADLPALPSFPVDTKRSDPRYPWYRERYGRDCWELDALSPVTLRTRVEQAIETLIDQATWTRYTHAEQVERTSIEATVTAWQTAGALP